MCGKKSAGVLGHDASIFELVIVFWSGGCGEFKMKLISSLFWALDFTLVKKSDEGGDNENDERWKV